jgi:hypothetical protein
MLKGIEGGNYYKVVDMDDTSATLVPSDKNGNVKGSKKVRHKLSSIDGGIKTAKRGDENGVIVIKESVNEALLPADTKVVKAFFDKKPLEGRNLNTDGKVLKTAGIGSQEMYTHTPNGVKMVGKITGKYAQSLVQFVNKNYKSDLVESVNEASLSDIDIIAQEAKDFKDFVIQFYKEYKDFPKTKESMKWLAGVYKNRSKMEGLK